MIITICGPAGSGKSSVSKLLAEKLGFRHYSMGDMRRKMAQETGITLAELNKIGEQEDFTDKDVDEYQKKLGETEDNFVIDGRMSWHFIPKSLKVYLDANIEVRSRREFENDKISEKFRSLEEAKEGIQKRDESDILRYRKYYNLNVHDKAHFDLVIDTSNNTIEQTVNEILEYVKKHQ